MSTDLELLARVGRYALSGSGLARFPVSRPLTAAANWLADFPPTPEACDSLGHELAALLGVHRLEDSVVLGIVVHGRLLLARLLLLLGGVVALALC